MTDASESRAPALTAAGGDVRFDRLIEAVLGQIDAEEVVAFHQRLVRLDTVNPPGDVRAAASVCKQTLADAGLATKLVAMDEAKPNVVATLGDDLAPVLCFNAHLDVVPIGERTAWVHDPFGAEIAEGRIYGRGAGDDKASVAAQVMAAVAVARSGVSLRGRLVVTEVADEEVGGQAGSAFIVAEGHVGHVRPDFVIVGEQTMNRVCVGEKGTGGTTVTVRGKTAHGALPWEGANAVEAMAEIIAALRRDLWPLLTKRTHEYFHHSSASINVISGGVKTNVVPDLCTIFIDRRLVPGEEPAGAAAEIRRVAEAAIAGMTGISVEVELRQGSLPATVSATDEPLVRSMLEANQRLGLSTEPTGFSMATDGRFFAQAGYPTIIYGPGDPSLAHVPDEWVGIEELLEATRAYAVAAVLLLGATT